MDWKDILWDIPVSATYQFVTDSAFRFGAAVSFYAMLSLAPLLVLVLSMTALFVQMQDLKVELLTQIEQIAGSETVKTVTTVLEHAERSTERDSANFWGILVLVFASTAVFAQLQDALNEIWGVRTDPGRVWLSFLLTRLISFGMVLAVGFLLLVSLVLTAIITAVSSRLTTTLPSGQMLWETIDVAGSFAITTLLFAMIFKFMPDVRIAWSDVWIAAVITSGLFTAGKTLFGFYIGQSSLTSVYGAAGSLVAMLFWIYYSSLTVFLGAEIAQVYTRRFGSRIRPRRFAVLVKK